MKNKFIFVSFGLACLGLVIVLSINNQQRSKIQAIEQEIKQVSKQQQRTTKQLEDLQTNYNTLDEQAKSKLIAFVKGYYNFSSQADYEQRYASVENLISLSDEQKAQLFDSGLDDTGGSKIDNLGLRSQYDTAIGYTSEKHDDLLETIVVAKIKMSSQNTRTVNQTVLIHGWYDVKSQKFVSIKINDMQ
ncbi:hypothetical protein [Leuconostoc pseudomesenteroides]|uniref:hypothetical protein n=1 Tax=Leuconostoc pseudomesenteroides TaxID=33968 RepID=UPI0032DF203A